MGFYTPKLSPRQKNSQDQYSYVDDKPSFSKKL